MATIESQIGSVASKTNQPIKKFVVDDPTMGESFENYNPPPAQPVSDDEIIAQFNAAKKNKLQIAPNKKRIIECLLNLRKITKSITIDGLNITLRNLNSNDSKLALKTITDKSVTNIDLMFYSRNVYIAMSLDKINGEKVSDLLNEEDEINIDLRLSLIEEMTDDVVKELYDFYQKEISINLPQTQEEIKEVNLEIKKS